MNGFADRTPNALYVDGMAYESQVYEDRFTVEVRRNAASVLQAETELLAARRKLAEVSRQLDACRRNLADAKMANQKPSPHTKLIPKHEDEVAALTAKILELETDTVPIVDVFEFPIASFKESGPSFD